jgi:tRNA threonylcarbamoyladenosine biosynthesis protein TsaB
MTILAINTATKQTSIALLKKENGVRVLAEKSWESNNDEAEKIMPEIAKLFDSTDEAQNFADIKHIFVIKGPGSFTGLRIGVTVANTIAYLNGCGITELNTFEYLHKKNETSKSIPVLLFAGKGGVYLSENAEAEPKLIDMPDLPEAISGFQKISGDISADQKEKIYEMKNPPEFAESNKTFGEVIAKHLETKELEGKSSKEKKESSSIKLITPLYIKNPSITESKKPLSLV